MSQEDFQQSRAEYPEYGRRTTPPDIAETRKDIEMIDKIIEKRLRRQRESLDKSSSSQEQANIFRDLVEIKLIRAIDEPDKFSRLMELWQNINSEEHTKYERDYTFRMSKIEMFFRIGGSAAILVTGSWLVLNGAYALVGAFLIGGGVAGFNSSYVNKVIDKLSLINLLKTKSERDVHKKD